MAIEPIRVGLVGYGYWGPNLARNLRETDGVEVVGIAEMDPARRVAAGRRYPEARLESTVWELIEWKDLDAVVVATPLSTHYELVREALENDLHVLVTKPLADSLERAQELAALAAARDRILLVDHTFVYTGAVQKISELLPSLGELLYIDSVRVNLGLFQHDCDVVWDLAAHDLSILRHLLGQPPSAISAIGSDPLGTGRASGAYVTLWHDEGPLAHVHVNWLSPVKVRRMLFAGSEQMALYDDLEPSEKVRVYDAGAEVHSRDELYRALVEYRRGDCFVPKLDGREALALECEHFVRCIGGEEEPLTGAESALDVVATLEAASRSLAEEGARVPVALGAAI